MQQQKSFKVLLLGDSCIDRYSYVNINRLNPEASVPLLDHDYDIEKLGMCSNVKLNLESIDIEVKCITNNPNDIIKSRIN